jgi:hypothetical protein
MPHKTHGQSTINTGSIGSGPDLVKNRESKGMNNRIKFLVNQAGIGHHNLSTGNGDNWQFTGTPKELEKFAQLIVEECLNNFEPEVVVFEKNDKIAGRNWAIKASKKRVKQHFGDIK